MRFFLSCLALTSAAILTACTVTAPVRQWQPHPLFQEGNSAATANGPAIWTRDGFIPRTSEPDKPAADLGTLPPHSGAVTGTCATSHGDPLFPDRQTAGPLADEQITIRSKRDGVFVTRTDENGVFVEIFMPGEYEISCRSSSSTFTVREGRTSLIRLTVEENQSRH
jgi:hypothetical protein